MADGYLAAGYTAPDQHALAYWLMIVVEVPLLLELSCCGRHLWLTVAYRTSAHQRRK